MNQQSNNHDERRSDIDWLRVLAVLLLIPFHSALIFNKNPNAVMYIKDLASSKLLDCISWWVHQFHMPLLFFISGTSVYLALRRRNWKQFLNERFSRLFVPMLFGIVLLVPPMTYFTLLNNGISISFWEHYFRFWHFNPVELTGLGGNLTPAHLWFLIFLFLFSLLALPLFNLLRRESCTLCLDRLGGFFAKRAMIFLFVFPLMLMASLNVLGDKNPFYYFLIFFLGYLFMTDNRYQQALDREAPVALLLGVVFEIVRQIWYSGSVEWSPTWMMYHFFEQMNRWFWLIAILGFGHRGLNRGGRVLNYLTQASYPFYLFHLLNVTFIGYVVIQMQTGIAIKFSLIVIISALITFLEYEFVRRIPGVRFLCGIKTGKKKSPA